MPQESGLVILKQWTILRLEMKIQQPLEVKGLVAIIDLII